MASMPTTTSEPDEYAGTDPFTDFDGAYSVYNDEPGEPSNTLSEDTADDVGYQRVDTGLTAPCEGTQRHPSILRRVWGWVRRLLGCL